MATVNVALHDGSLIRGSLRYPGQYNQLVDEIDDANDQLAEDVAEIERIMVAGLNLISAWFATNVNACMKHHFLEYALTFIMRPSNRTSFLCATTAWEA